MLIRACAATGCALILILAGIGNTSAATGFGTLRPAILHSGDVSHAFVVNQSHVFPKFSPNMNVAGKICTPSKTSRGEWRQGLHQVFLKAYPPSKDQDDLETCAFLYKHDSAALSDFRLFLVDAQNSFRKHTTVQLHAPKIGDGVVVAIAPVRNGLGAYLLAFRYRNALVGLSYVFQHTPLLTATQFVHLAQVMAGRLARGR